MRQSGRVASTVALLMGQIAATAPLFSQGTPAQSDSLLFEIASTVVRGGPHTDRVWPGGWFQGDFAFLASDGRSVVVLSDPQPEPVAPVISSRPIEGFFRTAYLLPSGHPEAPDRRGRRTIDGRPLTLVWPVYDSVFGIDDPLLANAVVLYHEFFHTYQLGRRAWSVGGWDEDPPNHIIVSEAFQTLAERERVLLAEALVTSSRDSLDLLLEAYLGVRSERMEMLPRGSRAYEADHERIEGTAQLVGYAAGLLAVRGSTDDLVEIVRSDLLGTPPFDEPLWRSGPYRDWHIYATGSAMAILLGRLDPDGSWMAPLARNASFPELLRRHLSGGGTADDPRRSFGRGRIGLVD